MQGRHTAAEAHGWISASCRGGPTAAHASRSPPHPASVIIHQHLQSGRTRRVLRSRHRRHVNGHVNSTFNVPYSCHVIPGEKLNYIFLASRQTPWSTTSGLDDVRRVPLSTGARHGDSCSTMRSTCGEYFPFRSASNVERALILSILVIDNHITRNTYVRIDCLDLSLIGCASFAAC